MSTDANHCGDQVTGTLFERAIAKLSTLQLPQSTLDSICAETGTVTIPLPPWQYTVTFSADHPRRIQDSTARWLWLSDNCGVYKQDWDICPAYSFSLDSVVYFFKSEDLAVRFKLTWL